MHTRGISEIVLIVEDVRYSARFYAKAVGLVVEPGRRYWVEVSYDKGKTPAHEYLVEFVPSQAQVDNGRR